MMEAIIAEEYGDVDVCYGDYDGHTTNLMYEVAYFVDGDEDPIDRHYPKTLEIAEKYQADFEAGLWHRSEFGGVEFEEDF